MLSNRKTNSSQQPDVSSGRHRKQALVFTQAVRESVCERERERERESERLHTREYTRL